MNITNPRLARSLSDLQPGQELMVRDRDKPWYEYTGSFQLFNVNDAVEWFNSDMEVVIVSDPPPKPVTVTRDSYDRLVSLMTLPFVTDNRGRYVQTGQVKALLNAVSQLIGEAKNG